VDKSLHKLMAGEPIDSKDEQKLLGSIEPEALPQICRLLMTQRRALHQLLKKAQADRAQVQAALDALRAPPLHPAMVLRVGEDERVDVFVAGRRQLVVAAPEVSLRELRPGDEVVLNNELTTIVAHNPAVAHVGSVATAVEQVDASLVVRGIADEETVAMCAPELLDRIEPGDRVVVTSGFPYVIDRLPQRKESPFRLEALPPVTFGDIGGLDGVIEELRRDLDLHLIHAHRLADYRLSLMRGFMLVGPPGVGKSMLAAAIANYVAATGRETQFQSITPGSLRSMWYGESERRIIELFDTVKAAPGLVVLFFDEIESMGARGAGLGTEIDGRVLGTFLAQVSGLGSADNVLCIGATNRLDLCDIGLIRAGRFGDRTYHIGRPRREAARQIFQKYVTPDLPYARRDDGSGDAPALIESALAYLYGPDGGTIANATLADGSRREISARDVLSGALIASAVEAAKHAAAHRHLQGGDGLGAEDVLEALDVAITSEASKLCGPNVARQVLDIPGAQEIVRVELAPARSLRRHRYLRAA
jgi:proteasome-associated ATPase